MIRIISKIIGVLLVVFLFILLWYMNSKFRIEYEFDTKLPSSTKIIKKNNAWMWIPNSRKSKIDRNISYRLSINNEQFEVFLKEHKNCVNCNEVPVKGGSDFSFYPIDYGDVKHIIIIEVLEKEVLFDYTLDYN